MAAICTYQYMKVIIFRPQFYFKARLYSFYGSDSIFAVVFHVLNFVMLQYQIQGIRWQFFYNLICGNGSHFWLMQIKKYATSEFWYNQAKFVQCVYKHHNQANIVILSTISRLLKFWMDYLIRDKMNYQHQA